MKQTEFLDVNLDLQNDFYRPYRKPNSEIIYVNKESNHPSHITREVPKMVNKRLQKLSKNSNAFDLEKEKYQAALRKSGYKHQLKFESNNTSKKNKTRKRKIIYFQPPFCKSVESNIGKLFLSLVRRTFTKDHPLQKILNPRSIKLSYSCLANVKQIITSHNKKLMRGHTDKKTSTKKCNCRNKKECPLNNNCLEDNIIYQATITTENEEKTYVGSTGNSFKSRYGGHKSTFNNKKTNHTALSKYIWKLKDQNLNYKINWKILQKTRASRSLRNGCNLCNLERLEIAKANKNKALNKRSELKTQCPHYKKCYFKITKSKNYNKTLQI